MPLPQGDLDVFLTSLRYLKANATIGTLPAAQ